MNKKRSVAIMQTAMKFAFIQLIFCMAFISVSYANKASAQDVLNKHVTVTIQNTEIKKVIVQLQQLTEAKFIYSSTTINANRKISISVSDKTLKELLDEFFVPIGIDYKTIDDKILLYHEVIFKRRCYVVYNLRHHINPGFIYIICGTVNSVYTGTSVLTVSGETGI